MLPLYDHNDTNNYPAANQLLIMLIVIAFGIQIFAMAADTSTMERFGFVPERFWGMMGAGQMLTVFTSMFMHSGFWHIIANLWFLHIFGDNVEDRLGYGNYIAFYIFCGVFGALFMAALAPGLSVPCVGASGAISGVMGAYLVLFPGVKIRTLIGDIFPMDLPTWFFVGQWFVMQLVLCYMEAGGIETGIGWQCHLGGFIAGATFATVLASKELGRPAVSVDADDEDESGWVRVR